MKKTVIEAPAAGKPVGPYSQAVMVGDSIFVCGEKGVDPVSGKIVQGGVGAETRQTLRNIQAILEAAGSSLKDVVRCVVYMCELGDFPVMNEAYGEFFPEKGFTTRNEKTFESWKVLRYQFDFIPLQISLLVGPLPIVTMTAFQVAGGVGNEDELVQFVFVERLFTGS